MTDEELIRREGARREREARALAKLIGELHVLSVWERRPGPGGANGAGAPPPEIAESARLMRWDIADRLIALAKHALEAAEVVRAVDRKSWPTRNPSMPGSPDER